MNNKNKIAVLIIVVLVLTTAAALMLNRQNIAKRKEMLEKAQIEIKWDNNTKTIDFADISQIVSEEFEAVLDTSTTDAVNHMYTGVEIKALLEYAGVDLTNKEMALFNAADSYTVAYSIEEINREKDIYLAYMEDGGYLGSIDTKGRGPYEAIVISDIFSNRRCKWVTGIEVK